MRAATRAIPAAPPNPPGRKRRKRSWLRRRMSSSLGGVGPRGPPEPEPPPLPLPQGLPPPPPLPPPPRGPAPQGPPPSLFHIIEIEIPFSAPVIAPSRGACSDDVAFPDCPGIAYR